MGERASWKTRLVEFESGGMWASRVVFFETAIPPRTLYRGGTPPMRILSESATAGNGVMGSDGD